jgi:hypothetical protein
MTGSNLNRRWTPYTDTRGMVREDYRSAWCLGALRSAADAGIPGQYLSPEGWSGRDDDIEGFWSGQVYAWHDTVDSRCSESDVASAINRLETIASNILGDNPAAVWLALEPFINDARLIRLIATGAGRWAPKPKAEPEFTDDWGCPSGPEHDGHGHGKHPLGWVCLSEEDSLTPDDSGNSNA